MFMPINVHKYSTISAAQLLCPQLGTGETSGGDSQQQYLTVVLDRTGVTQGCKWHIAPTSKPGLVFLVSLVSVSLPA